ncbi:MAG: T9SS type A sorting domain-containing protein [Bacteroidales bacterium]|nr:T9SS type A sorting domain-containing protein [Bacteroidales bacterium]
MVVYHDKLVVAGLFYKQNGNAGNFIMTWDGQQWGELGGGTCGQLNNPNSLGTIYDMQVYNDKLYICGLFNYAGTTPASHVAVWDGERWCGYPGVFDNSVYAMTIFKDTIYIACGMTIDGDTVNNFARWGRGLLPDTCGSVGISYIDYDKENVLVYPNPCNNYIWIESADQNFSDGFIEIVDFIGKTYGIKKEIIDGKVRINTLSLAKGIYLLKITSGNSIYSCKFIKE